MQCPKCLNNIQSDSRFCFACGTNLEQRCPDCALVYPGNAKFCSQCGGKLLLSDELSRRELSFNAKFERLQRYLPEGLAQKIISQRDKIEGERKQVTVMFADIAGFTALVEKLNDEEAYSLMDQVYEILIHKVHDFEGTVNELTGDGIMALFGAPIALENAHQRAIQSACEIHRALTKFSNRKMNEGLPHPILMRVGIHTGPVVVGTLGNDLRVDFKAVGDTVNLASRIEQMTEPGSTYVTEEVFKLTEGLYRFEALKQEKVKGKEKPIKVYRVIAPSTLNTRFEVNAERGLTPFLGRSREIELIRDGFERVKGGRGQVLFITAEAGVGKTRLIYELRKLVTNEEVTFREARCLSYRRNDPYHLVLEIVRSDFNILEGDSDAEVEQKIQGGLKRIGADLTVTLPYLLELLSIKKNDNIVVTLSGDEKKIRYIRALKELVLKGSEVRPLILAVDDLHWVDKSSEEALKDLAESIKGSRVLLIFSYRPEYNNTWRQKSYYSVINLNRLSYRDNISMAGYLLDAKNIGHDLMRMIDEKTEGVPFYLEEMIKSFRELKLITKKGDQYDIARDVPEMKIPLTIESVIMARVDILPVGAKEILQIGSVAEKDFSVHLLKKVTDLPENELADLLTILNTTEIAYERGIFPESSIIFSHSLINEVIYDSITRNKKNRLHEAVADAIEDMRYDTISEQYTILSEHYSKSENYFKTAKYSKLAAIKAANSVSFFDAINYTKKRVTALEKESNTDGNQSKVLKARLDLALFHYNVGYLVEAKESIDPIFDYAIENSSPKNLSLVYTVMGAHAIMVEEDSQKALEYLYKALNLAKQAEDVQAEIYAEIIFSLTLSWVCEFESAEKAINKTLNALEQYGNSWNLVNLKCNLSYYIYNYQGMVDEGYQTSYDALQIANTTGDILSKATAFICHGISGYFKGYFTEAKDLLAEGAELGEEIQLNTFLALAHQFLGYIYYRFGQHNKSQKHLIIAIDVRKNNSIFPSTLMFNELALARTVAARDHQHDSVNLLHLLINQNKVKLYEGSMARYFAEILINANGDTINMAEPWLDRAITIHKKYNMRWHLGKDYLLRSILFEKYNNIIEMQNSLATANRFFIECGADGWAELTENRTSLV